MDNHPSYARVLLCCRTEHRDHMSRRLCTVLDLVEPREATAGLWGKGQCWKRLVAVVLSGAEIVAKEEGQRRVMHLWN